MGLQSCHFSRQDSLCFLVDFHFTFPSNEFQEHAGKALVKPCVSCICVEKRKPHLYFLFTNATFLSSSHFAHQWCIASYLASEWLFSLVVTVGAAKFSCAARKSSLQSSKTGKRGRLSLDGLVLWMASTSVCLAFRAFR